MNADIAESLKSLATPLDKLIPLPGNPRVGNIESIMSSYREFGQQKPVVIRPNDDGTATVIAGNHQVEAARRLGWTHIAAVPMDADDARAIAFALADNRTNELGHTDPELLHGLLETIVGDYTELLDELGWDEFELAAIEEQAARLESVIESGYIPPVIIGQETEAEPGEPGTENLAIERTGDTARIVPPVTADKSSLVTQGSTSIAAGGSSKAIVQYTLVFDDADQQAQWYKFIRWLRLEPSIDGDTTAQRLMNFLDAHADY